MTSLSLLSVLSMANNNPQYYVYCPLANRMNNCMLNIKNQTNFFLYKQFIYCIVQLSTFVLRLVGIWRPTGLFTRSPGSLYDCIYTNKTDLTQWLGWAPNPALLTRSPTHLPSDYHVSYIVFFIFIKMSMLFSPCFFPYISFRYWSVVIITWRQFQST